MEESKTKRTVAKQQFTRAENSLRKVLAKGDSLQTTIGRKFNELSVKWQTVQDTHDVYVTMVNKEEEEKENYWLEELIERYEAIEIDTDIALLKLQKKEEVEVNEEAARQIAALQSNSLEKNHLQLERLKLDKFDGDIRKYPAFKERFKLYIEPMCPSSQLPFMLRSHLDPVVKEEVENIEDNVRLLWQRLDSKYGNQRKYIDVVLTDLSRISKGDGKAALHLINTVDKAYRDLSRIGAGQEMCNSSIIAIIEKKLPDEIRFDWVQTIAENGEVDSSVVFEMLLVCLKKWRQVIEYDEAAIRKGPERKSGAAHFTGIKQRQNKNETCWIHEDGEHPIWKCRIFQAMSHKEKLDMVKEKLACHACLEVSCKGSKDPDNCSRKFKCQVKGCDKSHNVLLHND